MEYPKTDAEIRMYCLELTCNDLEGGKPDVKKAQEYYDFICPPATEERDSLSDKILQEVYENQSELQREIFEKHKEEYQRLKAGEAISPCIQS